MTVIHLLRHGEVSNPRGVLYGRLPDFHLSPDGEHMAKAAAAFLAGRDVTLVLSSPLERALETASPVAAQFGLEVRVDERLIEPWNHFEGGRFDIGFPALRRPGNWPRMANPFRPSWGEPYSEHRREDARASWPMRPGRRAGTRRCLSVTSWPSGWPAGRPRNAGCGTIRPAASVPWAA